MIAKGNLHAHGRKLAHYLVTPGEGDRAVELVELSGFASENIREAFTDVQIQAAATNCQKPFFHCYIRLPEQDALQPTEWRQAATRIETVLGFAGQGRAIALHHLTDGTTHMHIAWSRIDTETMRAIDPGLYKNKLKEVSRQLESEMGLTRVSSAKRTLTRTQTPSRNEFEQSRRLNTDLATIRETIRDCWDRSDSGHAFVAALAAHDLILATGKRPYVVIDPAGGDHAVSKRITGVAAQSIASRFSDLQIESLPTVEAAKAQQYDRALQARGRAMSDVATLSPALDEERRQEAVRKDDENRRETFRKDAEAQRQREAEAIRQSEWQRDRQVEQLTGIRQQQAIEQMRVSFLEARQREAEHAKQVAAWQEKQQREEAARPQNVNDAGARYSQALGQHYDVRDPYGTLARAAMAEHAAFVRDREALTRQMSQTDDPAKRAALEVRRDIEMKEYMAITSNRIATQSEIIQGQSNTPEAVKQRERAAGFQQEAAALREQLKAHTLETRAASPRSASRGVNGKTAAIEAGRDQSASLRGSSANETTQSLLVIDKVNGNGKTQTLETFAKEFRGQPLPKEFSAAQLATDGKARRENNEQQVARANRTAALDCMDEAIKKGRPLDAKDLRTLDANDMYGIRRDGEQHLRQLLSERERERLRERKHDRER